jgi:subtilisin family serine protease
VTGSAQPPAGDRPLPAWSKDSVMVRLDEVASIGEVSHAWAFGGATGAGVRVAVIDSGIDADHPDLHGCVDEAGSVAFAPGADGEIVATPGPHRDSFGHGTACAGIIHELAPEARITSVKVLGEGLSGTAAAFLAGLEWAVAERFDVINLSLGSRKRDTALAFHDLCDRAYFGGSLVVTAANNAMSTSYPSLFASVASVACNMSRDPYRYHVNPHPPTEFLARGIDVEVPWTGHGTTVTTGNSFAAPHISGLAALVRSKHPELRPFQVKSVLWARAANVVEASAPEIAGRLSRVVSATAVRRAMSAERVSSR